MPLQLVATVPGLRLRCKEFASLSSAEILLALQDAALQVNTSIFGPKAALAQTYLAAHFLSVRNPLLALPVGPVQMDRVGNVSRTDAVSAPPASEADYNSSRWGRAYITLGRQNIDGRIVST